MIKEVVLLICFTAVADAVVCRLSTCLSFQCGETTCPPGFRVKIGGGFCGCCNNCVRALNEGEACNPVIKHGGNPHHKGVTNSNPMCDYGLECDSQRNKCVKEKMAPKVDSQHDMSMNMD